MSMIVAMVTTVMVMIVVTRAAVIIIVVTRAVVIIIVVMSMIVAMVIAVMVMIVVTRVVVVIIVVMMMMVVSGLESEKDILVRQNMTPLVAVAHNTIANCTIIRQNSVGAHHLILCVVAKVAVSEIMACNCVMAFRAKFDRCGRMVSGQDTVSPKYMLVIVWKLLSQ